MVNLGVRGHNSTAVGNGRGTRKRRDDATRRLFILVRVRMKGKPDTCRRVVFEAIACAVMATLLMAPLVFLGWFEGRSLALLMFAAVWAGLMVVILLTAHAACRLIRVDRVLREALHTADGNQANRSGGREDSSGTGPPGVDTGPAAIELSPLERDVLERLLSGEEPLLGLLRAQLVSFVGVTRTLTGTGFYVELRLSAAALPLPGYPSFRLNDVDAQIDELANGAGFALFVERGLLKA